MDAEQLKKEIRFEAQYIKDLSCDLSEIKYNLEFCPCCDEVYKELEKIGILTNQIAEIIETMQCYKNMSII